MKLKDSLFLEKIRQGPVLFDGAMGTELIRRGLTKGECPESWNLFHPDKVKEIHLSYFKAGATVITTNSFGGHPVKLQSYGLADKTEELNRAAARIACEVRQKGQFVVGSLGPAGKIIQPYGPLKEAEAEEGFYRQAKALASEDLDGLLIETMYDLREALIALRACRQACSLPIIVTMTFQRTPRGFFTLMGQKVEECLSKLEIEGADGVGANCTLTSREMAELTLLLRSSTSLPLIIQPNAGQPIISPKGDLLYSQSIEDFVAPFKQILEAGVQAIGGCCGTNPDYIRRLAQLINQR
ncbi:MAG: homocysteine S-methyltransferase family protein [Candidatus Aminicenantes bacterium]|nr:homocysteine S-methyltransferase family protein [Candidatus Aminicenantes bacterium]